MTTPQEERLHLAKRNAAGFAQNPAIIGVLLVGSVARGTADNISDIDCSVYYNIPPNQAEFEAICNQAIASGGGVYGGTAEDGFAVYEYIDGIKCDFGHIAFEQLTVELQQALDEFDLDDTNQQIFISGFYEGTPLYGEECIRPLQAKFDTYPPQLASQLVSKYMRFHPRWVIERMGAERNDTIFLHESFLEGVTQIFNILCAINQIYPPGKLKGMFWTIGKMKQKPAHLLARLEALFREDPFTAVTELYNLIEETLVLLEIHLPDIDTMRVRRMINLSEG